jgi:hypothetical protein
MRLAQPYRSIVAQRLHLMHFSRSSLMAREDCYIAYCMTSQAAAAAIAVEAATREAGTPVKEWLRSGCT